MLKFQSRLLSSHKLAVNNSSDLALKKIVECFDAPIRFCAAYGSGVFPQETPGTVLGKEPIVDLIFGVTHAQHWHSLNIRQNPHHYSYLRFLGSKAVETVQCRFGAGIYYNTNCIVAGRSIKYGVITISDLLDDLRDWDTLYCAGRMQKPVRTLLGA